MIVVGSLVSFFFYRQKKLDDRVDIIDNRLDKVEINQAGYNKSVDHLIDQFKRMEKNIEKMLNKD